MLIEGTVTQSNLVTSIGIRRASDVAIHAGTLPSELGQLGALEVLNVSSEGLSGTSDDFLAWWA